MNLRLSSTDKLHTLADFRQVSHLATRLKYVYVLIYFLLFTILLSPRIPLGSIQLRVEDFLFPVILLTLAIIAWQNKSGRISSLTLMIVSYLAYAMVIASVFFIYEELNARFLLYLGKETQFFAQFLLVLYWGRKNNNFAGFEKFAVFLLIINVGFGLYQIISGDWYGYYGIGTFGDPASAASGSAYFICLVVAVYLFKGKPSKGLLLLASLCMLCLLATISKTFIIGALIFLFALLAFEIVPLLRRLLSKSKLPGWTTPCIVLLVLTLLITAPSSDSILKGVILVDKVVMRFSRISSSMSYREQKSYSQLSDLHGIYTITGRGKSFPEYKKQTTTLAVDNQYVRHLLELGLMGSLLWSGILLLIVKQFLTPAPTKESRVFLAFFVAYLAMGLPAEIFQTAKSGAFFWFLTGYLLIKHRLQYLYK